MLNIIQILHRWQDLSKSDHDLLSQFPLEVVAVIDEINRMLYVDIMAAAVPLCVIFQEMFPYGCEPHEEVWHLLCNNPTNFWYM